MRTAGKGIKKRWARFVLEQKSASGFGLLMVLIMGVLGYVQAVPNWSLVTVILIVIGFEFQKRMDQGVPLLQLTCLLAVLQWLVGPVLCYTNDFDYFYGRYSMRVNELIYFQFAMPATCVYIVCMLFSGVSVRQTNIFQHVKPTNFVQIGILLNIISLGATVVAGSHTGGGLAFFLHLISQLRYVGALYFLFSRHPLRILLVGASFAPLILGTLGSGFFHDFILWAAIVFCFWFAQRKWQVHVKLAVLASVTIGLFAVQVVKQDYRKQLREGRKPSLVGLVSEYLAPGGKGWGEESLSTVVTRLNQGWIIAAVLKHVPEEEQFANGQTVVDAAVSAALPRLLYKEKKIAGGRDNFRRFTGLQIHNTTSMGISPLGEAYANFGVNGGIFFMFVLGVSFALVYRVMLLYALQHPTFLFWMPVIFYQAIKAETELLVVFNQLVKGSVIAFGCHYLTTNMIPGQKRLLVANGQPDVRT